MMATVGDQTVRKSNTRTTQAMRNDRIGPTACVSQLAARALLEGYPTPPLTDARYLEINCGQGTNLLAQAAAYPEVSFTGTSPDPSVDILAIANHVKIQNLHMGEFDLQNFESALGTYDFIMAADVFATASTSERMALLLMSKKHLADDGVMCIDVDLYPGWRMVENLRDALAFDFGKDVADIDKVSRMRIRIDEMIEAIKSGRQPNRRPHLAELTHLASASDAEVFSVLLDPKRRACSIAEFMEMADAASLKLIGDVDPLKTNPSVLPTALRSGSDSELDLKALLPKIDQYTNTRHRRVLLCHVNREQQKQGLLETLDELFIASALVREDSSLSGVELFKERSVAFDGPIKYQTSNQMEIVALALMEQNKNFPVRAGRLVGHVATALRKAGIKDVETREVGTAIAELCNKLLPTGAFVPHVRETRAVNKLTDRPRLSPLALYQARQREPYLTSLAPHRVRVDDVACFILGRFDGTQTLQQIYDDVKGAVAKKEISIPTMGETPDARARAIVLRVLAHAAKSALLTSS